MKVNRKSILLNMKVGDSLYVNVGSAVAWQQFGKSAHRLNIKLSITNEAGGARIWRIA